MSSIRARKDNGLLFFDFRYQNKRCREQTMLADTAKNRKRLQKTLDQIDAEITLGTFEYHRYFPNSKRAADFDPVESSEAADETSETPLLRDFIDTWWNENEIRWRHHTRVGNRVVINRYLLPYFGDTPVAAITKADALAMRAEVAKLPGRNGNATLSAKTLNNLMMVFNMIMAEAADRYDFINPLRHVRRLKQPRKEIQPFRLEEVQAIINTVRSDFRPYYIVRFFTGMRTGEVHGLKWDRVDWDANQILVRETYSHGRVEYTKTDGSQREIDMSSHVRAALEEQYAATGHHTYVFCSQSGTPLDANNIARRVWKPLLNYLGLAQRRPYQCRHTAATLWLASGENPEWIARQLGHSNTEMLFRVYSRYIPNLTRRDGSAFDNFVSNALNGGKFEETS